MSSTKFDDYLKAQKDDYEEKKTYYKNKIIQKQNYCKDLCANLGCDITPRCLSICMNSDPPNDSVKYYDEFVIKDFDKDKHVKTFNRFYK